MKTRRPWLLPLAPLYGVALAMKRRLFQLGWMKQNRLENPVISVGSVSAGGAGKTPMVLMLARILRHRGYAVRILTRGYKRSSGMTSRVEPFDDAAWQGDEPVLLAQRSGVPVFVGADRYQAGVMAEHDEPSEKLVVHLLDDGFQHRKLARDVDIVLLTQADVEDTLLPAGNLREPLSAIAEADVVVLREEEAASLRSVVAGLSGQKTVPAIWVIRRSLSLGEGGDVALPTKPLAFCGIARPESFPTMLAAQGYEPMDTMIFPDHHAYGDGDIRRLIERARQVEANGFVTTEKDAVKLTPILRDHLETIGPVVVARLGVELLDEQESLSQLIAMVGRLDRRRH
ncbi:MAG TPA: tetraacyldisaccharide 4'-kinase [Edaphobacter sp.]|nr:tetraacyldisaccharide 4'-kinase [Edaphobacter sp.]